MKEFLFNLDGKQKIALIAILVLTLLTFLDYQINTTSLAILAITTLIILSTTKNTIRYFSLFIILSIATMMFAKKSWLEQSIEYLLTKIFPKFGEKLNLVEPAPLEYAILAGTFVLIGIFIVNYFMKDNTAMGMSQKPIDEVVPEGSIKDQMKRVIGALCDDLRSIDIKTNWSIHNFVPLDAEVEVSTGNRKQKKITKLLNAIQKSDDRLFLVLGDPGSGKSVSLRKLARELADESNKTGKIPIYINLKEWNFKANRNPTVEDIKDFVLQNILNRDIVITRFFKQYFDRLYEEGRLYFIFDSFDEIPMLLNEREGSELIQYYSEIFFKFLKGARADTSQGVLSSRIFRKPTRDFQVNTTLEIRPFDDEKIISMFKNLDTFNEALQIKLFKERHDLIPVARNPFTAQLISDYAEKNDDKLPKNQADMYKSYIISTLESCEDKIERANLTVDRIFQLSIDIAQLMFDEHGFEISKSKLIQHFDRDEIENVINILKFSRLGRVGNDESNFSFVHRRFAEYFIVEKMILNEDNIDVDYKSIPEDSKWRDALVLYCEVASLKKAKEIANFCWKTIDTINNPNDLRVIHTVRFLRDAFKGRKECLTDFENELYEYIDKQIHEENETLQIKLAVESVGLLESKDMDKAIVKALSLNNYWISDTALKSCRHLQHVSDELIIGLKKYIWFLPLKILFKNKKDIAFSFNLSSAFKNNLIFFHQYFYSTLGLLISSLYIISFLIYSFFIKVHFIIYYVYLVILFSIVVIFIRVNNKPKGINKIINISMSKETKYDLIPLKIFFILSHILAMFTATMLTYLQYAKTHEFSSFQILQNSLEINSNPINIILFIVILITLATQILKLNMTSEKTIYQAFKVSLNSIRKVLIRLFKQLIVLIFIALTTIPTFIITSYLITNYFTFLFKIIDFIIIWIKDNGLFVLLTVLLITFGIFIIQILKDWFILKKAYKDNLSARETIEYYYQQFKYEFIKIRFLDYVNANFNNIKGEWKAKDILKVSPSKADIYLAQLEEKWSGIEK